VTIPTQHDQQDAQENLAFIRRTMESASTFTAVSGWGMIGVVVGGLIATTLAWSAGVPADLRVWLSAALVSIAISAVATAVKAQGQRLPLWTGAFRKIAWVMTPTLVAGALLTFALTQQGTTLLLPGIWLAMYGAGVTAGGNFAVRAIRWMGIAFLALGAIALFRPDMGLALLGVGFGGLHVAIGIDLVWRHGG
jgi:hypothetical protein